LDPVHPVAGGQDGFRQATHAWVHVVSNRHKLAVAIGDTFKIISLSPRRALDPVYPVDGDEDGAFVLLRRTVVPNTYRHKLTVAIGNSFKIILYPRLALDPANSISGSHNGSTEAHCHKLAVAVSDGGKVHGWRKGVAPSPGVQRVGTTTLGEDQKGEDGAK